MSKLAFPVAPLLLLLLAACGGDDDNRTAGGVTANEARALDEAAEMLEQRRLPDDALRPGAAPPTPPSATPPSAAPSTPPER